MDLIRRLARFGLVTCLLLVTVGSLLPGGVAPPHPMNGLVVHALAYGVLGVGASLASETRSALLAALIFVWSVLIELAQGLLVPGRDGNPFDVAANAFGVMAGYLLARSALRRAMRSSSSASSM